MMKQAFFPCMIALATASTSAQMPVPVLSDSTEDSSRGKLVVAQADTGKQLETLLLRKPGTSFTAKDVGYP